MRYEFFVTVWGEPFVRKFLDYSIAGQLSVGNLPALSADAEITFHIFTDRLSEPYFYPGIKAFEADVELQWHYFEDIEFRHGTLDDAVRQSDPTVVKHNVQRITSQQVLASAAQIGAAAVLLDSDFIFADGAFARMHALRKSGKKGLAAMFLRLEEDSAGPRLRENTSGAARGWDGLSARKLVRIGLDRPHHVTSAFFVDAAKFTGYPTQLNWRVSDRGFVTHCFFPHPIMVMPSLSNANYFSTMDYECSLRCVDNDDDLHLARSSDEFLVCKMSPARYLADAPRDGAPAIDAVARFALNNTNLRHSYFMKQPLRYVAAADDAAFAAAEGESSAFVEAVYKAVELGLGQASADNAQALVFMKSFLGPIENFMSPQVYSRLKDWLPER